LKTLKVWHDNNAIAGSDWELSHITVTDPRDGTKTLFNCHSWLSKSKGWVVHPTAFEAIPLQPSLQELGGVLVQTEQGLC
jgi:hypothetical protein